MAIKMSESEYQQQIESLSDEGSQAWMDYIGNGGSMDPSDTFDAGWNTGQARIRQLEELNKALAAEVDRCRPVVEAAIKWNETNYRDMKECELALDAIGNACDDYEAGKPK